MSEAERIAQAFVAARREGQGLERYPGRPPETLDEAYAIQSRAIGMHGVAIGGWKVGRINPPLDTRFGINRLAGPIFADQIVQARPDLSMPVFADGFAAAEAEFLLRIGAAPDPAKKRYTIAEATALIDAVHAGIEIASSPYPGINDDGPAVTISDFGNNYGLIVGPEIADWRDGGFLDWQVELLVDDQPVSQALARDMLDGPFGAAAFLFEFAAARGIALQPGQWISSGAVTGVHRMYPGQRAIARFDRRIEIGCTLEGGAAERKTSRAERR